jgi:hypothetical protein
VVSKKISYEDNLLLFRIPATYFSRLAIVSLGTSDEW